MKKTMSPASKAPTIAQPIPMPAAAPVATPEPPEPFDGGFEVPAEPAEPAEVVVAGPVPVEVVDEVADGVGEPAEADETFRGSKLH